jgi:hypothetical protein
MTTAPIPATSGLPETVSLAETRAAREIEKARDWAAAIDRVVKQQRRFVTIEGKRYILSDAWLMIAALDQAAPVAEDPVPIVEDGKIVGYRVSVKLVRPDGAVRGRATMTCYLDEYPCRGKRGTDAHRAAISAATTWAAAKAAKLTYGWVVVLAGYEPTLAEEAPEQEKAAFSYSVPVSEPPRKEGEARPFAPEREEAEREKILHEILFLKERMGMPDQEIRSLIRERWGKNSSKEMSLEELQELKAALEEYLEKRPYRKKEQRAK